MKIFLTGGTGAVGRRLKKYLGVGVIAPTHEEFDVAKKSSFIASVRPDIIIHAAAIADANIAEPERTDKSAKTWQINVEGTKYIVSQAKKVGAFVVYISTASVFASDTLRTFDEDDHPCSDSKLSWYAITKKYGEEYVRGGAIIRLSHPDPYVLKLIDDYKSGNLPGLFPDQKFSLTLLTDVAKAITTIIRDKKAGIYHVTSVDACSPHALVSYALNRSLPAMPFATFQKKVDYPLRYSQYHVIDGKKTTRRLSLPTRTWKQVVDSVI